MKPKRYKPPYEGWPINDAVSSFFFGVGAIAMFFAAGTYSYSLLMESGNVFYYENKVVAVAIASLSVWASLALKAFPMVFIHDETRLLYFKALFSTTIIIVLIWLYLMAQGNTAFSLDDILAPDSSKGRLAFIQLVMEILLGACLASAWQRVHDKYQRTQPTLNPMLAVRKATIAEIEENIRAVNHAIETTNSELAQLQSQKHSFIHQHLERLSLMKARHAAIHNLLGDQ